MGMGMGMGMGMDLGRDRMDNTLQPIRKRKLSDEVRDRLLAMLNEGGLRPGDVLPSERELMARYGVGRPAVREAMQSLQGLGLIDVRHGERPKVARATMDTALDQMALTMHHALSHSAPTLEHLKEVRLASETHLARIAARTRTADDLTAMRRILSDQEAAAGEDGGVFLLKDGAFHAAIAAAAGNPIFTAVITAVFAWMREFHASAVHRPGLEKLTMEEHHAILERLVAQDGAGAARAMRHHLVRANRLYSNRSR